QYQFIERMNAQPLAYAPGDSSIYSDWGFILTGFIIERITGQRLDRFLEHRIWGPLGMRDTGFNPLLLVGLPDDITCISAYRPGHSLLGRIAVTEVDTVFRNRHVHGVVRDGNAGAPGRIAGHAGQFSSARGLSVGAHMMLNGRTYSGVKILEPDAIARWTARQNGHSSRAIGWDTPSGQSGAGDCFSPR